jgi:hypothetical protein
MCPCRGQRLLLGFIFRCSPSSFPWYGVSPNLEFIDWLDWLASRVASTLFQVLLPCCYGKSVHSAECSCHHLIGSTTVQKKKKKKRKEEKDGIGPASVCIGLQSGEKSSLPYSLANMMFCPCKHRLNLLHQICVFSLQLLPSGLWGQRRENKYSIVQFKACRMSFSVQVLYYVMGRQTWVRHSLDL